MEKYQYRSLQNKNKKHQDTGVYHIQESKIIVPIYKNDIAPIILEKIEKNSDAIFIYINLKIYNKICSDLGLEEEKINWSVIIAHHLPMWISLKCGSSFINLTKYNVNGFLNEFFTHMPFIKLRFYYGLRMNFGHGFDKELKSKDYTHNDYARFRLKEQLKYEIIDKLSKIEVIK